MSLRICSFASGSKGNCCYVSDGRTDILIDLGISATRAEQCLALLGVDPNRVAVLITHSHSDHVGGLKIFKKKHTGVAVLCQAECLDSVSRASGVVPTATARTFNVGTLEVTAMPVSHDVPCFGYVVTDGSKRVAVVTDVGTLGADTLGELGRCDIVMLEANHDVDRLNANPRYTPALKARIHSDSGHLSNGDCATACAFLASRGVRNFILAHLSEDNNDPILAVSEVKRSLHGVGVDDARVVAALQKSMTGLYEVC